MAWRIMAGSSSFCIHVFVHVCMRVHICARGCVGAAERRSAIAAMQLRAVEQLSISRPVMDTSEGPSHQGSRAGLYKRARSAAARMGAAALGLCAAPVHCGRGMLWSSKGLRVFGIEMLDHQKDCVCLEEKCWGVPR